MFASYAAVTKENDGQAEMIRLRRHKLALFRRGAQLVVTFDMKLPPAQSGRGRPFCHEIIESAGYSHLVVRMRQGNDWYRDTSLFDAFDQMRDSGFFDSFDSVSFLGSTMGGYAALAYSTASPVPGCWCSCHNQRWILQWSRLRHAMTMISRQGIGVIRDTAMPQTPWLKRSASR